MKRFSYRGRNAQGKIFRGQLEATTQSTAADQLLRQGIIPLEIKLITDNGLLQIGRASCRERVCLYV